MVKFEYFKNFKKLSSFMKEPTKTRQYEKRIFDFFKKTENQNYI